MKKIALVNVFFPPQTIGGATRVLSDNIDTIVEKYSDEIELVGFCTQSDCRDPYKIEVYPYRGFKVYRVNCQFRVNMDWHPKDPEFYRIFSEFLEFEQPDLIHFHCVQRMSASVVEAARDSGIPYVVTVHDAWWISDYQFLVDQNGKVYPNGHTDPYEDREYPEGIEPSVSMERVSYLKSLLNSAVSTLHVSKGFEELYIGNGIEKTTLTKNGISSTVKWLDKDTSYTSKVVVGHIGGMSDHKGYDIFLEALGDTDGNLVEALVVDHSKEPSYEQVEYVNSVRITFIGRQPQHKIIDVYKKMDILFAPSKWPESFGLVTREAAACGCWVVASNLGGIGGDVIEGETGFIVEPTTEELRKVFNQICDDPGKYKASIKPDSLYYSESQVDTLVSDVYLTK